MLDGSETPISVFHKEGSLGHRPSFKSAPPWMMELEFGCTVSASW